MPGNRVTPQQIERFLRLREKKVSVARAAKGIGVSAATGYRLAQGFKPTENSKILAAKLDSEMPKPKAFDELDAIGKEMLKDFALFSAKILCRTVPPWRVKAAERSVEMLMDQSERHFVVANEPPGVGKSTLWTLDIPMWLLAGGGSLDPAQGRALRIMLGHRAMGTAIHYVQRLQRILKSHRPYYDFEQGQYAELCLADVYGRFKPDLSLGDPEALWSKEQFIVAQGGDFDLYQKEPTVQAASREKGFVGERVNYAAWDDLVDDKHSFNLEIVETDARWMETETERRLEPGGVFWMIGQRIGPNDLFRNRLNKLWEDDDGAEHALYNHIVFPAHNEPTCDGHHRQWDAEPDGSGCLLDENRLPWKEIQKVRSNTNFRTVFQQEDSDPTHVLVPVIWLEGGIDFYSEEVPGCWDKDRGFWEWPTGVDDLIDYACVDPSATGWWAIEHWSCKDPTLPRYLIAGTRRKMGANELLDWRHAEQRFTGIMEDWQARSVEHGHPIRVWVIEFNAMARWLAQFEHFHRWKKRWKVEVIGHQTQRNKTDPKLGVEALLPGLYRDGMKRIPYRRGDMDVVTYAQAKKQELTTYQIGTQLHQSTTTDTIMADWEGEFQLQLGNIMRIGKRALVGDDVEHEGLKLPPYLERQYQQVKV